MARSRSRSRSGVKQVVHKELSWEDFVNLAEKPGNGGHARVEDAERNEWAGATFKQAIRMARTDGYHEAIPEADKFSHAVSDTIITDRLSTSFEPVWDVTGSEVDMGRFLAGIPENMVEATPMRIARRGRAVRIAVPVCYACNVRPDIVMRRGAAVMALVDVLARAQHPLEVWAGCNIHGSDRDTGDSVRGSWMVRVQEANAPLDMGRIMFALAHPSMLRRLFFAVEEHEPPEIRRMFSIGGSYGHADYHTLESDLPDQQANTIILPDLQPGQQWSADDAVVWIESTLATIFGEAD